ncbi:DUF3280 domain-containing protein [Poseidonocella sp. HB161398]|uniref:DUF3280 domain-containing protein n=1 Tax=Poseidonocella sp. HB161398 TaxID=2320855 RepID=UPI001109E476|nr:DUF3280 domain-containing protein [Poseidonocella sp. HB161398]
MIRFAASFAVLALAAGSALAGPPPLEPGSEIAFLGITFLNTSPIPTREEELGRVEMLEEMVRARFEEEGLVLADLAPIAEELDGIVNPANCYGCETRMARKLGARYVATGEVQKVSELILAMNLVVRDTAEGAVARAMSVDIRSNTDNSWSRGMRYILNNAIFRE